MANGWHLAQVNVGRLVAAMPDPRVVPFFEALDRINAPMIRVTNAAGPSPTLKLE